MMIQVAMKKKNLKIKTPLDPLEYDLHIQLEEKNPINHEKLEMILLPLEIFLMKIKMTKDVALRVFTPINTTEIDLKQQDFLTRSIGSCL